MLELIQQSSWTAVVLDLIQSPHGSLLQLIKFLTLQYPLTVRIVCLPRSQQDFDQINPVFDELSSKTLPMFLNHGCSAHKVCTYELNVSLPRFWGWRLELEASAGFWLQFLGFKSKAVYCRAKELRFIDVNARLVNTIKPTDAASRYLLEALTKFWRTQPWACPFRILLLRECSRRLRHISRSAYKEDLFYPPLGHFVDIKTEGSDAPGWLLLLPEREEIHSYRRYTEYKEEDFNVSDIKHNWDVSDDDVNPEDEDAWSSDFDPLVHTHTHKTKDRPAERKNDYPRLPQRVSRQHRPKPYSVRKGSGHGTRNRQRLVHFVKQSGVRL